jgi:hypothetical protein
MLWMIPSLMSFPQPSTSRGPFMFATVNLNEIRKIAHAVITEDTVARGRPWKLDNQQRKRIRVAMFGASRPKGKYGALSPIEQKELTGEFTKSVINPLLESLPQDVAAWAALVLYEEFVDAVFIQPLQEDEAGQGD